MLLGYKHIVLCGSLLPLHVLAQPLFADYHAVYKVFSTTQSQQIGTYQVALEWHETQQQYLLQASIDLSYRVLWKRHRYHYEDRVWFDARQDASFTSEETTDNQWTQTTGQRDTAQNLFKVQRKTAQPEQTKSKQWLIGRDYDFTTFSLRFPQACNTQSVGKKVEARILDPIAQQVSRVSSVYIQFKAEQLPLTGKTAYPVCTIITQSERKAMNKRSWVSAQGYLVYEESPLYRLVLDTSHSNLPLQRLKGEL